MSSMNTARIAALVLWCASLSTQAQTACNNLIDLCGQVDSTVTLSSAMDLDNVAALNGSFAATSVQVIDSTRRTSIRQAKGWKSSVQLTMRPFFRPGCFSPTRSTLATPGLRVRVGLDDDEQDTVLYTAPLYINTDYILLVGSNTPGCALDVRLEGRSVSIDACCAAAIDYGETVNVEVKGRTRALGFVWTPEELAQMVDNQLAT